MKVRIAVIAVILCFVFVGILQNIIKTPMDAMEYYETSQFSNKIIVLDAGHGGMDGGAVGIKTDVKESDINLKIVLKLKTLLESVGYQVILTRSDEKALCKGKFSKKEDMSIRAEVIKAVNPDFVISIHLNSYPSTSVKGAQVFYYPDSEQGKLFADCVQTQLKNYLDADNKRTVKEGNFIMLHVTASPAIMVEGGFLSCPEEEAKLISDEYQSQLAYAVLNGVIKYEVSSGQ